MSANRERADKKIVVTGATGMVGSYLVAELLRRGYRRIALPVRNRKRLSVLHKILSREKIDVSSATFSVSETTLNNPHRLNDIFKEAELVFNCAAMISIGGVDEQTMVTTNVEIAQHVVNASLRCGAKKLVHVSSISALGTPQPPQVYVDEETLMESTTGASAYGKSKFLSENEIIRGSYLGLDTVIVNPATIIGGGNWESGSGVIIPALSRGLKVYTEGVTAWVDVRDVARAMVTLAEDETITDERFLLAADNISFRELVTMVNKALGKRPPTINIGHRVIDAASKLEKIVARLTKHEQLVTEEIAELLLEEKYFCGKKIEQRVDFQYTPLQESVERVVKEYLEDRES